MSAFKDAMAIMLQRRRALHGPRFSRTDRLSHRYQHAIGELAIGAGLSPEIAPELI